MSVREVLRAVIKYWRDSRDPSKGAKDIFEYITRDDLIELFNKLEQYRRISKAVASLCDDIADREAEKYAKAMCGSDEKCFDHMYGEWRDKQGVRIERQCINIFNKFVGGVALDASECVEQCRWDMNCVEKCLTQKLK